jgi:glutamate synthase (NADPH/NADH) small chain
MVYRRTEAEMPCTQAELDIAKLDGCEIIWLAAPKKLIGKNGQLTAIECERMELGAPDNSGRRSPVATGETFVLETDMVIKAAGQMPYSDLVSKASLQHKNGCVVTDTNGVTNLSGVFAGGDCVNGGKEVVDAVQAGKDGAKAILSYLNLGS